MSYFDRRALLQAAGSMAVLPSLAFSGNVSNYKMPQSVLLKDIQPQIQFISDGIVLSPFQYSVLLQRLTNSPDFKPDNEGKGGILFDLEQKFASVTGKEKAIYMPSGTMANQLAIRILAMGKSKVYTQETSHLMNDEGDAAQELHHKRLMPLAPGKASFTLEDLQQDILLFRNKEIFPTEIGAISIENPVKRLYEEVFDIENIRKISAFAQAHSIGMHLDGARLHIASAYTGISVREYASYFDTVQISLYKYFGATGGSVLCGPSELIDKMPHLGENLRRQHGLQLDNSCYGSSFHGWLRSSVSKGQKKAAEIFKDLNKINGITIKAFANGSNVHKLVLAHGRYDQFVKFLAQEKNIRLRGKKKGENFIPLKVNETVNYISRTTLVDAFSEACTA